jgi:hypothetical protein
LPGRARRTSRPRGRAGNDFAIVDEHGISPKAVFPGSAVHNLAVVQQAVDPGAGAITTAPAVARIFALLAEGGELDGVRFLSRERVTSFTKPRQGAHDPDKVLPIPVWFGAAGFWLGGELGASDPLVGDHREIIYSPGAGGTVAWADLQLCKRPFIGVRGHTMNRTSSVPQCATYMRKPPWPLNRSLQRSWNTAISTTVYGIGLNFRSTNRRVQESFPSTAKTRQDQSEENQLSTR